MYAREWSLWKRRRGGYLAARYKYDPGSWASALGLGYGATPGEAEEEAAGRAERLLGEARGVGELVRAGLLGLGFRGEPAQLSEEGWGVAARAPCLVAECRVRVWKTLGGSGAAVELAAPPLRGELKAALLEAAAGAARSLRAGLTVEDGPRGYTARLTLDPGAAGPQGLAEAAVRAARELAGRLVSAGVKLPLPPLGPESAVAGLALRLLGAPTTLPFARSPPSMREALKLAESGALEVEGEAVYVGGRRLSGLLAEYLEPGAALRAERMLARSLPVPARKSGVGLQGR